jgi:hypothetical protein
LRRRFRYTYYKRFIDGQWWHILAKLNRKWTENNYSILSLEKWIYSLCRFRLCLLSLEKIQFGSMEKVQSLL